MSQESFLPPDWDDQLFNSADFSAQADDYLESEPLEEDAWFDDGYSLIPEDYTPSEPYAAARTTAIPASLVDHMNTNQRQAVETLLGPLMVVAGPGSGKTRVLTHRIAALVATELAKPWEILAVTFTNKAAAEMRERISALVGPAANDMWVSTFHSACVRILRANAVLANLPKSFSIVDASDSQKIVKTALLSLSMPAEKADVKEAASIISRTKNSALTSVALAASQDAWAAPVFDAYNERLEAMGSVDFDDILLKTLKLLNAEQGVRERYQRKFKFVLVDEYQDTNAVQYQITQILAAASKNLCVVGDLDQSVYSWRGATPEAMGGFSADYPDAKTVTLEQNYRSTKAIVETYRALIAANPVVQQRPNLFTDNPEGDPVRVVTLTSDRDEAAFVVKELKSKPRGESTAVLMRTNSQTRTFEEELTRHAIPYSVVGALRFYDRAEVKDALSYLRFALNPLDAVSFARCVNTPRRGIGEATVSTVVEISLNERLTIPEAVLRGIEEGTFKGRAANALKKFLEIYEIIEAASEKGPAEGLRAVSTDAGLHAALLADKSEGPDRVGNLEELISGATLFEVSNSSTNPDVKSIAQLSGIERTMTYLENVALVSSADTEEFGTSKKAVLLTAHASKGKEFDHVWVVGVEDTLFPHAKLAGNDEGLEEERRLLFVACSRPRLTLTLTKVQTRMTYGKFTDNPPSPFLNDLPESVKIVNLATGRLRGSSYGGVRPWNRPDPKPQVQTRATRVYNTPQKNPGRQAVRGPRVPLEVAKEGLKVSHIIFGEGIIEELEGTRAHIQFGDALRILDIELAPLTALP